VTLRSRALAGLLLLALLATSAVGWLWHERASAEAAAAVRNERCARFTFQEHWRAARPSGSGPRVVVIGDSWSSGFGLATPQRSWPVRLAGRVHVDGFPGSGFSERASSCRGVSYADRAPRDLRQGAALVVVEGGLNDFDQSDAAITAGFRRLMRELHGHRVVVVGPPSAPERGSTVVRVDRLLASLCAKADVPYFGTRQLRLTYLPDRLHPDQHGANIFGDAVAAFIAAR
jgi:acyl-CoA thioesterase-1